MTISFAEQVTWLCNSCHREFELLTWLALDAVERPDLRSELANGTITHADCPHCGKKAVRPVPLLLTRLANRLPVAVAADPGTHDDPLHLIPHVLDRVRASFGHTLADVPGPALIISFDLAKTAGQRDIDVDLGASALEEPTEEAYTRLLEEIVESEPDRRVQLAVNKLRMVNDRQSLDSLMNEYPEITSGPVREVLRTNLANATTSEERDLASIHLSMVEKLASGNLDAAWKSHVDGFRSIWQKYLGPKYDSLIKDLEEAERKGDLEGSVVAGRALLDFSH